MVRRSSVFLPAAAVLAAAALAPAAALAAPGEITPGSVTPAKLTAPGTAVARFTVTGDTADAYTPLTVRAVATKNSAYGHAAESLAVTDVKVEGSATLTTTGVVAASLVPSCVRGAVLLATFTNYRLDVKANATATLVVTVKVPRGLPASKAGVTVGYDTFVPAVGDVGSSPRTATAFVARTNPLDGVSLQAGTRSAGKVTLTGRVVPARSGAKVTIAGVRTALDPNAQFGLLGPDLRPLVPGLKTYGTTRTGKDGRYSITVPAPANAALVASTGGPDHGTSCPVKL